MPPSQCDTNALGGGGSSPDVGRGGRRARIVIVDDNRGVRAALRVLLEREGFDVAAETADYDEAVDLVVATQPDAVLLDWLFEGRPRGALVLASLRRWAPRVPVVVYTAYPGEALTRGGRTGRCVRGHEGDRPQCRACWCPARRDRPLAGAGRAAAWGAGRRRGYGACRWARQAGPGGVGAHRGRGPTRKGQLAVVEVCHDPVPGRRSRHWWSLIVRGALVLRLGLAAR